MGLLSLLGFGGTISKPIEAIANVFSAVAKNEEEKAAAQIMLDKLQAQPEILQAQIDMLEAQSKNWFEAGWRPAIGWIAAIALFLFYVPQYIMGTYLWTVACLSEHTIVRYPIDDTGLNQLIFALLGLGVMRTAEKFTKVAK